MNQHTFTTLGLEELRAVLARHVQTPLGRVRVMSLMPSTDRDFLIAELLKTTECVDYLSTSGGFGLGGITDPTESLNTLRIEDASLDPQQVLGLLRIIGACIDIRAQFSDREAKDRYPRLSAEALRIKDLRALRNAIAGKILPNGEIDDGASPELRRIRREIIRRRKRIYDSLESMMKEKSTAVIQDEIVTIRNNRFVIPVKTDSRGQIPGVIHGLSSSGQTSFVEPLAVIDQNNDLARLHEEEQIEIARILLSISNALRDEAEALSTGVESITILDVIHAKARLSRELSCVSPELDRGRRLLLENARHPLLELSLRESGSAVVPISFELDDEHQTLVVSGPNAGGKTVVVKTAGLLALMAHMGMHVPATRAVFPCLQQVQADIGDEQSLAANLSTFTAHMRNISEMAATVSPPALILIDEVGTGTDPDEGAALAVAIVEYFARAGATTIATTHYNELKAWASQAGGVLNGSVEFDEKTLRPTYRLLVGIAGASSGIEIARRMNLPATIVERAGALLDPEQSRAGEYLKQLKALIDEQTAVNAALQDERHVTAEKFSRLEADFTGRELERRSEFERELSRVIREFTAESRSLIEQIKDRASAARLKREADARAAELRRSAGARLRKQTEAAAVEVRAAPPDSAFPPARKETPAAPELSEDLFEMDDTAQIRERDSVRIKGYSQVGRVESIEDGVYAVLVGSMRMRARREDLQLVRPAAASSRKAELERATTSTGGQSIDQSFTAELNIIGTTVDEATDRVDKFLDEAFLAGAEAVRLVHGHGTGALRRAVAALLTGHPHVERFQSAPANQGGAGATIVELRK